MVSCLHQHSNIQTHSSREYSYSKITRESVMVSCISLTQLLFTVRYLLPCLAGALIAFVALIFGYFGLEETKDKTVPTVRAPSPRSYSRSRVESLKNVCEDRTRANFGPSTASSSFSGTLLVDEGPPSQPTKPSIDTNPSAPPSALELLRHLPLQRVITSSFVLSILATSYDVVFSLLCYTPIHLGGLSRTVRFPCCPIL